jgi:hypothetical protein
MILFGLILSLPLLLIAALLKSLLRLLKEIFLPFYLEDIPLKQKRPKKTKKPKK